MTKRLVFPLAIFSLALPALAQNSRFTGHIGGGFSEPVKDIGTRLDRGWNIGGGAGVNVNSYLGILVDFTFNRFAINNTALNQVGVSDGSTRIWGLTLGPKLNLMPEEGPVNVYVTGGGGVYHRTVEFTEPGVATITAFDPWWGIFYPANVPTNVVVGSHSVTKPGVNVGAGLAFRLGSSNAKLFAEARYHHMFTRNIDTTFVPVTFGVRW